MTTTRIGRGLVAIVAATLGSTALAQYPQVPEAEQARAEQILGPARQRSAEAWKQALPIVEEWPQKGRPYLTRVDGPDDFVKATIPAFPGAEGPAMWTVGGRGGRVFVVTSLDDSGPGTFREALEAGGPRVVVFNVAGIIRLQSPVSIRAPYITISGATAPGDGVCIAGETVHLDTHDIVIRHLRFRRGETWVARRDDAIGGNPVGNVLIDHVSASWGLDENMSFYRYNLPEGGRRATTNVTVQWSISSEALGIYNHSFGSTIGGNPNAFHHNLYANNAGRNPSMSLADPFNWINNVVFNWRHRTADGGVASFNGINNYYKPGPVTDLNNPISHRIVRIEGRGEGRPSFYVSGNIVEGNERVTADNWAGGVQRNEGNVEAFRATEPRNLPAITIHSAQQAYELVLAGAGATLPRRDAVDLRIVENVRTGQPTARQSRPDLAEHLRSVKFNDELIARITSLIPGGIITDPADVGGYPEYKGEPYPDADRDGLPDDWERQHGLNPQDASDATQAIRENAYTNIECFLNDLDPRNQPDWTDLKHNVDTRSSPAPASSR
jgi:hypothetical protein